MRHLIICALVALPAFAHADSGEIQMPDEPVAKPRVAARTSTAPKKGAKAAPRMAPAKEDEPAPAPPAPAPAPAKEEPAKPAPKPVRVTSADQEVPPGIPAPPETAADPEPASAAPATPTEAAAEGQAAATGVEPTKPVKHIEPFGAIAGGVMLESLHQMPSQHTGTQNPTVAVSRLGVRGSVGEHITYASAFEATLGGSLGYGASVWEGQASLAILDQWVRYARDGWAFAAGRIDDPASFDFVSEHVTDLLLSDMYTRDPLLYSGADRGNGIWGAYDINKHVTAGLTFHSTNPTGITGTLIIGGKLVPFDRPFYLAAAQVGNSQNNLPDQNLHIYFGSPSLLVHYDQFEAKAEVQMYSLDTQESMSTDQPIRGYNVRAGAKAWTDTTIGRVTAFANFSRNKNEILDPTDSLYRLPDLFKSYTVSSGFDWNYAKHNGVGFQYALVDTTEPDQHSRAHYLNLGTTYWIEDSLAIGVRGAVFAQQISGEPMTTGERSLMFTARLILD